MRADFLCTIAESRGKVVKAPTALSALLYKPEGHGFYSR